MQRKMSVWRGFRVYEDNLPLPMPGIYRFTNLVDGKTYNGVSFTSVLNRCGQYPNGKNLKFYKALRELGTHSFLCEPVFYTVPELLDGEFNFKKFLHEVEADHIATMNSVANGYNTAVSSVGGPGSLGEEWSIKNLAARKARSEKERITGSKNGWKHSEEFKQKVREARKNQVTTEAMLSALEIGRLKLTPEQHKARMAKAWETRRKNNGPSGLSETGLFNLQQKSPETVEKMRAASFIREAKKREERLKPKRKRLSDLTSL